MTAYFPDNPRGEQAVAICAAFTSLALLVVAIRLYTRFFLVRCPGIEDYGITVAVLSSTGFTVSVAYQAKWGMGRHIDELDPVHTVKILKAFWLSLIFYQLSLILQKMSMLLQYRRVFTIKWFQIACGAVMAFVLMYGVWLVFGSVFACLPVRAFWTREPGAKCINQFAMWFTNAAVNITQDFIIITLPMPVIRSLNLGRRQKGALMGIFAVGGFVCVVSILRLPQLVSISNSTDPTYDNISAATWSSVETNIGITCSCLPILRPLLTRYLPGVFSSHKRSKLATPRPYSTIGNSRGRNGPPSPSDFALKSTGPLRPSSDDDRDIKVITDIRVQVENDELTKHGWNTSTSGEEWTPTGSTKEAKRARSSTDSLVKEPGSVV